MLRAVPLVGYVVVGVLQTTVLVVLLARWGSGCSTGGDVLMGSGRVRVAVSEALLGGTCVLGASCWRASGRPRLPAR